MASHCLRSSSDFRRRSIASLRQLPCATAEEVPGHAPLPCQRSPESQVRVSCKPSRQQSTHRGLAPNLHGPGLIDRPCVAEYAASTVCAHCIAVPFLLPRRVYRSRAKYGVGLPVHAMWRPARLTDFDATRCVLRSIRRSWAAARQRAVRGSVPHASGQKEVHARPGASPPPFCDTVSLMRVE